MSMKITPLKTYWTADQADTVIMFLDELRDLLWETYSEQIIEMRLSVSASTEPEADPTAPAFDDTSDF